MLGIGTYGSPRKAKTGSQSRAFVPGVCHAIPALYQSTQVRIFKKGTNMALSVRNPDDGALMRRLPSMVFHVNG
jgi:hypothetical protein